MLPRACEVTCVEFVSDKHSQQQQQVLPTAAVGGRRQQELLHLVPVGQGWLLRSEQPRKMWTKPGGCQETVHEEVCHSLMAVKSHPC